MVHQAVKPLDAVFAALGDPTRQAIVEALSRGEATIAALAAPFAVSLQAVIKHVKVLEEAGLVRRTKVGRANHVALVPEALAPATAWLQARTPAPAPLARVMVPVARGGPDLRTRARELHAGLAPRMALVRRALDAGAGDDGAAAAEGFAPADAVVRALRAAHDRRPALEAALRLYDDLGRALAGPGEDLEALRAVILPLGRAVYDLRALLPGEAAAA